MTMVCNFRKSIELCRDLSVSSMPGCATFNPKSVQGQTYQITIAYSQNSNYRVIDTLKKQVVDCGAKKTLSTSRERKGGPILPILLHQST